MLPPKPEPTTIQSQWWFIQGSREVGDPEVEGLGTCGIGFQNGWLTLKLQTSGHGCQARKGERPSSSACGFVGVGDLQVVAPGTGGLHPPCARS